MEKALIRCPRDKKVFPQNTIVNLHQIRAIAKNRIISDLNCSAEDYILPNKAIDKLNENVPEKFLPYGINLKKCIELKLAQLLAPDIFYTMIKLQKENKQMIEIIEKQQSDLNCLKIELASLKNKS